jgi:hypothetical protein
MPKFDKRLNELYIEIKAEISLAEEKLASYQFATNGIKFSSYISNETLSNARSIIYCALLDDIHKAYQKFFMFSGMFTQKEREEIAVKAYSKYTNEYDEIRQWFGLDKMPDPKSFHLDREEFKEVFKELITKQKAEEIIDELESDFEDNDEEDLTSLGDI